MIPADLIDAWLILVTNGFTVAEADALIAKILTLRLRGSRSTRRRGGCSRRAYGPTPRSSSEARRR